MTKDAFLDDVFNNDPLGLLDIKPKKSNVRTADERLSESFQEINRFFKEYGREPEPSMTDMGERKLFSRLEGLRNNPEKIEQLQDEDEHRLLEHKAKELNSIDDIFSDDSLNILDDDTGLFKFKHTPKDFQRASSDFVARRKSCKDFEIYEEQLKIVQKDLSKKKRRLIEYREGNLRAGSYYVHNGVLFYLESITISKKDHYKEDGTRVREDGRTRCIFENGTESNMLKRSLEKILYVNGSVVTENMHDVQDDFLKKLNNITKEDKPTGFIYVLKSESTNEEIQSIENLFKIGYSTTKVIDRIKNAEKEPTYLMAPVTEIGIWECFNMNTQKFEQLLHNFFGNSCLNIDIYDEKGKKHSPREWFIAPIEIIEQVIALVDNGDIVNYKYDVENLMILHK